MSRVPERQCANCIDIWNTVSQSVITVPCRLCQMHHLPVHRRCPTVHPGQRHAGCTDSSGLSSYHLHSRQKYSAASPRSACWKKNDQLLPSIHRLLTRTNTDDPCAKHDNSIDIHFWLHYYIRTAKAVLLHTAKHYSMWPIYTKKIQNCHLMWAETQ